MTTPLVEQGPYTSHMTRVVAGDHAAAASGNRGVRRVRVAQIDAAAAGLRVSILLGPLAIPSIDQLLAAFTRVANLGPAARLGLVPFGDRHWSYLGAGISARRDDLFRVAPVAGPAARQWLVRNLIPDLPLQFAFTEDHLAIAADHRVADGVLLVLIPSLLLELGPGRSLPPVFSQLVDRPLEIALKATFGDDPHRIVDLLRYARRRSAARKALGAPGTVEVPEDADTPQTVALPHAPEGTVEDIHVLIEGATLAELRRWSSRRVGFTFGVTLMLLVIHALRCAELQIADRAVMVVNLRRYLPSGTATLGNFIGGVVLDVPGGRPVEDIADQLKDALAVGRPLVDLTRSTVRGKLFPSRAHQAAAPTPQPLATVSLSDNGTVRTLEGLPWLCDRPDRTIEIVGVVRDPASIAVISYTVSDRLHLMLSFRSDIYDPATVRHACEAIASSSTQLMVDAFGE